MLRDRALVPLSHQHQHALALCVQIDRALAAEPGTEMLQRLADTLVEQFDSEMRKHFAAEEDVLFPAMADFEHTRDLVAELLAEHRRLESLRDSIYQLKRGEDLAEFSSILRAHVRKEEGVLFEILYSKI